MAIKLQQAYSDSSGTFHLDVKDAVRAEKEIGLTKWFEKVSGHGYGNAVSAILDHEEEFLNIFNVEFEDDEANDGVEVVSVSETTQSPTPTHPQIPPPLTDSSLREDLIEKISGYEGDPVRIETLNHLFNNNPRQIAHEVERLLRDGLVGKHEFKDGWGVYWHVEQNHVLGDTETVSSIVYPHKTTKSEKIWHYIKQEGERTSSSVNVKDIQKQFSDYPPTTVSGILSHLKRQGFLSHEGVGLYQAKGVYQSGLTG